MNWISIQEKMPEQDRWVLVYGIDNEDRRRSKNEPKDLPMVAIAVCYYLNSGKKEFMLSDERYSGLGYPLCSNSSASDYYDFDTKWITHWMYVPEKSNRSCV